MSSKTRVMLALTAVAVGSVLMPTPAKADILYNWFGPQYVAYRPIFPRRTVVAYAPTVAYSPVATGCSTCSPTTVGYAPYTASYAPMTAYRPAWGCNTCATTTVLRPVTAYYQPVTSYYGGCSTCGVQTAAYAAPACSTCGVASGGCSSGNCGVNYGGVNTGCSTCGVGSPSQIDVQPSSNFVPNNAVPRTNAESTQTPTPQIAPQIQVPQTQVEPYPAQPEAANGPTLPMSFREPAGKQPVSQLKPIPQAPQRPADNGGRVQPRLVNPEDKTARAADPIYTVQPAVYTSEVPNYQSVVVQTPALKPATPALSVPAGTQLSQEELDAQGWGPAKR